MLPHLVGAYGYLVVYLGTFFEGEVVLAIAGFAARNHVFHLPLIMFWGFLGSLSGDQFFYWIGRLRGKQYLEKRPHWQDNADWVHGVLQRYKYLVMSGFRFLYGFRIVTPLVIGTSEIPYAEFLFFNVAGAAVWSIVVTALGYALGNVLELYISDVRHYEREAIVFILLVFAALWIWSFIKKQLLYKHYKTLKK